MKCTLAHKNFHFTFPAPLSSSKLSFPTCTFRVSETSGGGGDTAHDITDSDSESEDFQLDPLPPVHQPSDYKLLVGTESLPSNVDHLLFPPPNVKLKWH